MGETVVQYTAIDAEGNSRTCNVTITVQGTQETHASWLKIYFVKVEWHINIMTSLAFLGTTCEQPYVPVNGEFVCTEEEDGVNCTLHCNVGYSLTQDAVHSYFCAFDGVWKPPYSADRPDCSGKRCLSPLLFLLRCVPCVLADKSTSPPHFPVNRVANNGFKPFEMLFKAARCDDVDLVKSFAGELNTKLGVMVRIEEECSKELLSFLTGQQAIGPVGFQVTGG